VLLTEDNANSRHRLYLTNYYTATAGGSYVASIHFKKPAANVRRYVNIDLSDNQTGGVYVYIDTNDWSVSQSLATGGEWTVSSYSLVDAQNGWKRLTVAGKLGATRSQVILNYCLSNSATGGELPTYTGDAASGMYIWGAQLALASTTDQSYQRITDWTAEQYAWAATKNVPWLRRNRLLNTATLSTQTVSSVTATPLTVSFTGTGKIDFTTAYTGTLQGTGAGDRVTATFTPAAGNLVCTVTGTVTLAQCEVGSAATTYQEVGASWAATYTSLALAAGYLISLYSDRAGTVATYGPDDQVGKLLDLSGDNNHAAAPSVAGSPTLRLDGNGKFYLDRDTTDDDLQITWPTNLTATGVVYTATGDYTTKDSGLTLSGLTSYKYPQRPSGDYGRIVMAAESKYDAKIIKYLDAKRGRSYLLGPELVTNGGFDSATWWSTSGEVSISGGVATIASTGAAATISKSSIFTASKTYLISFKSIVRSGTAKLEGAGGATFMPISTSGQWQIAFSGSTSLAFNRTSACSIDIDDVSAREILL
jgi:hypothetical protein